MTSRDLKKLRSKLPQGASAVISSKTGLSVSMVNMVLSGKRNNTAILEYAIELARNYQMQLKETKDKIDAL